MIMHTEEYKGATIEIHHDEDAQSPRIDMDNLGTMVCFHRRYHLGDTAHGFKESDCSSWDELKQAITERHGPLADIIPVYMLDHSGLRVNTTGYSDVDPQRWDWGQIGYIYLTKADALAENIPLEKVTATLLSEVDVYDQYMSGDVCGYTVLVDGNVMDSCWGFYGFDYCLEQAKETRNV